MGQNKTALMKILAINSNCMHMQKLYMVIVVMIDMPN